MEKTFDASLDRFSSLKEEQDDKKRQRETLVASKAALDEDLASMNAQVQEKEDELQQIMGAKRVALGAKVLPSEGIASPRRALLFRSTAKRLNWQSASRPSRLIYRSSNRVA